MNRSLDPNATAARPADASTSSTAISAGSDPQETVDRFSASTDQSRVVGDAAGDLPVIPGYRVVRELARGGMGRVLAAVDLALDREVAIKVLLPGATPDRFVRESKITARLPHPGIPPVYEMGTLADGSPFLAMKLVVGHTLSVERKTADRQQLLRLFTQVCQAVGFAHSRGVIHRDLKPGNIMVGAFGEVLVMDWGLAKVLPAVDTGETRQDRGGLRPTPVAEDADGTVALPTDPEQTDDQTQAGTVLGTPAYMAPEAAAGEVSTPAADVYGLGAVLYTLLVGRPPYSGANVAEVLKQVTTTDPPLFTRPDRSVPPALVAVCRKAMARHAADRYPSAEALADDVSRWSAGEPVSVYREPWTDRLARWARRRRAGVMTAAGVLLALTTAAVVASVLLWQEQKRTKGEWDRAEGEKVTAAENGEAALGVVRVLSAHITRNEFSGNKQPTDQERKLALDQTLLHYQRLLTLHPDDEKLLSTVAVAHRFRANLCRVLNLHDEAEESYQKSIDYYRVLMAAHPSKSNYRIDLAVTYRDYSLQQKSLGHLGRSAELLDTPIRLYDEIRASNPDDTENLRRTAIALLDRAELEFQLDQFARAERNARMSTDLYVKLAGNAKAVPQPLDPLFHGMAEIRLAVALRELGRLDDAIVVHDQVVKRFAPYLGLVADNTRTYTFEYHRAQAERARTLAQMPGREAEVSEALDRAISGCENLVTQYPKFPPYQRNWAAYLLYRGRWNAKAGRLNPAAVDLKSAAEKLEGLAQQFPDVPVYRSFLGQTYAALGGIEPDMDKKAEYIRMARGRLEEALRVTPESALERKVLAELDFKAKD